MKCVVSINVMPTQRCLPARHDKHVDNRVDSGIYSGMRKITALQLTPQIITLLSEIDEFKGAWRAYGAIAPERLATLRQIATIESIGSSTRIEGSTLDDRQVEQLLAGLQVERFANRDQQEIAGYAEVVETVLTSWQEMRLTENVICQLHRDLLRHSDKDERHRGAYKKVQNDVGAFDQEGQLVGIVFKTASPFETPIRMTELLEWLQNARQNNLLHPLLIVAVFVVVFLEIHPFQDGNGRLSRALTTLLLLKAGYAYVPYASLEAVIEKRKDQYYLALRRTQKTLRSDSPDWQPWLLFFLRALQEQKRRLLGKIEVEQQSLESMTPVAVAAIEYARRHGRVTNRDLVRVISSNPNTAKATLGKLVEQGKLVRRGGGRSTWYTLA